MTPYSMGCTRVPESHGPAHQPVHRLLSSFCSQILLLFHKNDSAWTRLGKSRFKISACICCCSSGFNVSSVERSTESQAQTGISIIFIFFITDKNTWPWTTVATCSIQVLP